MGLGLSMRTLYYLARAAVPTYLEGLRGPAPRERVDARMRQVGRRVVEEAAIELEVSGRELVPSDRAFVYMSNHQSHVDIPVLCHVVPATSIRMVTKSELFRIPVWGRGMRAAGMVEVDRRNRARAIDSLTSAASRMAEGVSVWIAPEGSRSRTGALGPLKKGGFHLAKSTATPIVPLAISGTHRVLPPGSVRMMTHQRVRVVFGAPIDVTGATIDELMEQVAGFFAAHVETS